MRVLMKVKIPVDIGNAALKDGSLPRTLDEVFGKIQPEAAYFLVEDGKRCGYVVFDLDDPSRIPSIAEPLFQNLHAEVDWTPVMDKADLDAGIQAWVNGA